MQFRTQIPLQTPARNPIDYTSVILLVGSCFSENIANKLAYYKFQSLQNPFGILFHPKAIETFITNAINEKVYTENDLVFQDERWHCFDAHSSMSNADRSVVLDHLNKAIRATHQQIIQSTHIIITLGTSWVYRHIESDRIVANCHKIPQKKFLKELLSVNEIEESLDAVITLIKSVNPKTTILFTVSPVRHLKDGFIENTQSKSHLLTAIHKVTDIRNAVHYFPGYEIMMDELRDYRFYTEDMLHPNQTAINYIWERFTDVWISEPAKQTMHEVETIQNGMMHKPFHQNSEQHQKFLKDLQLKVEKLQEKFPSMHFRNIV